MFNKKEMKKIGKGILIGSIIVLGTAGTYATNSTIKTYVDNFSSSDSELGKLITTFFDSEGRIKPEFIKLNSIGEAQIDDNFKAQDSDKLDNLDSTAFQKDISNTSCDYGIKTVTDDGIITCATNNDTDTHVDVIDNLNSNDGTKVLSARQGKILNENKLGKTEKAKDSDKLDNLDSTYFRNATNINAGTLGDARLSNNVTKLGQTIEMSEFTDTETTLTDTDSKIPTSKAVKDYVDNNGGTAGKIDDLSDAKASKSDTFIGKYSGEHNSGTELEGTIWCIDTFGHNCGNRNVSVGVYSLYNNTSGINNSSLGYATLNSNTTGSRNTAIGNASLFKNTTGYSNTAIGTSSMFFNTTGGNNSALGYGSLVNNTTGEKNIAIGRSSLYSNENGNNNTAVGAFSLVKTKGSGNVALGHYAGYYETGSNKLYIDNSSTSNPLIYGEFDNDKVKINGKLSVRDEPSNPKDVATKAYVDAHSGGGAGKFVDGTNSNDTVYNNGNVGIGLNNPTSKLEIKSNSTEPVLQAGYDVNNGETAGDASVALGYKVKATGKTSTALGESTIASGHASTSIGNKTKASANSSTILGQYGQTASDDVFAVAYGNNGDQNTAGKGLVFQVKRNGDVKINGNLEVTGNINGTNGGTTEENWNTPTFQNGWTNYSNGYYSPAGYYKDSTGTVHLRGLVKNGSMGSCIFTLPAGYRSEYTGIFALQSNGSLGRADIKSNGCVYAHTGSNGRYSLDGITFRAN